MATYLFPGQSAQETGMGKDLFAQFHQIIEQANEELHYSLEKLILDNPHQLMNQTQYTQPALYVVSALRFLKASQQASFNPEYFAGHSLGEYNALYAAGVYDFLTGLQIVRERGRLMSTIKSGGMAAILGLHFDVIEKIIQDNFLNKLSIANYNAYNETVISGLKEDIFSSQPQFEKAGAFFVPLNTSGAFHSSYMEKIAGQFAVFLNNFTFDSPKVPVIANVNAKPYQHMQIKELLCQQLTSPVLWIKTIEYLLAQGQTEFIELSDKKVLSSFVTNVRSKKELES